MIQQNGQVGCVGLGMVLVMSIYASYLDIFFAERPGLHNEYPTFYLEDVTENEASIGPGGTTPRSISERSIST